MASRMAKVSPEAAAEKRQEMLAQLQNVVVFCTCLWPLVKYRNGDGHDGHCPAHVPLGSKRPQSQTQENDTSMTERPTWVPDPVTGKWGACHCVQDESNDWWRCPEHGSRKYVSQHGERVDVPQPRTVRVVEVSTEDRGAWPTYDLLPSEEVLEATTDKCLTSSYSMTYRKTLRLVVVGDKERPRD